MVTFVSLFLWLMTDTHMVQVAVDPAVVSVEIFLDGESIGVATEPNWQVECDFGMRLRPHELLAVARDEAGNELGRALQVVNLPRADAEVDIVFEGGTPEAPTMVRAITESTERLSPLTVFVTFDGLLLPKSADGRFTLPVYDPNHVHLVSAEAQFPGGLAARRDITFGGTYGGRITSELTAVPVILGEKRLLKVQELQGLFTVRGEGVNVVAVERQGGRVYVVRDHRAWPTLRKVGYQLDRHQRSARLEYRKELAKIVHESDGIEEVPPNKDRFYLVVPNPTRARGLALYPIIHPFSIKRWGFPWLATHIVSLDAAVPGQRLAEAVAVAGLRAAADGCPRAVVLMITGESDYVGGYPPESVREYLEHLRVPFFVWSTEKDAGPTTWGPSDPASGVGSLDKFSKRVMKKLRRQWIVWVEGSHLPNQIELADNELGIRLAR
jgi:hypothetical protein